MSSLFLLDAEPGVVCQADSWVCEPPAVYRPRNARASPLYALLETHYDQLKACWDERFQQRFGHWRGLADQAVAQYLDCGILERGLARVYCDTCRHEFAVAFSCRRRGLCPSCAAKRGAELGLFLREEVLESVGHAQWVFTLPKMVRPYFLHHRELLGELCRAAYQTVCELMRAALDDDQVRPGFIAVVQTFTSDLRWSPHVHALASRGCWTRSGQWIPLAHLDPKSAELLFRHKVLKFLLKQGRIDEQRVELLMSWQQNTGFSVDNSVTLPADDQQAILRLARYLMRSPVSLERLTWNRATGFVEYAPRPGHEQGETASPYLQDSFDPLEVLARVLTHVSAPKLHSVHYFGWYATVVRAARRPAQPPGDQTVTPSSGVEPPPPSASQQQRRRRWAELIRLVYEADPLVCPRCQSPLRILAFILDQDVIAKIMDCRAYSSQRQARAP